MEEVSETSRALREWEWVAEKITVAPKAIEHLADIGSQTSLRYAVQLLAPAAEAAASERSKKSPKNILKG